jgi:MerR family transcriptional regulator, light-induced transcriptional regulator
MSEPPLGPASFLGRREPARPGGRRPYPAPEPRDAGEVLLRAARALLHAADAEQVRAVVRTAVGDLGGAVVPARLEPQAVVPLDLSLGAGEPLLAVADPLSVEAMELGRVLPGLLDDARAALARLVDRGRSAHDRRRAGAEDLAAYLACVVAGDRRAAVAHVRRLLEDGVPPASVAEDVLAAAQREVGRRWYDGRWSVADEHAATAVAEAAVTVLPAPRGGPQVVFAAPEGEWHALPARLAAVVAGVDATVLGPGLPGRDLQRYLEARRPAALALSCTSAADLPAAVDAVRAAHEAGVPVVAGGRALGGDDRRARRLGADAWLPSPAGLSAAVADLQPHGRAPELPPEVLRTGAVDDAVLRLAVERHAAASPALRAAGPRPEADAVQDLRWIARHAAAALLVDDVALLDEAVAWVRHRPGPGAGEHLVPDACSYLADVLEPEAPRAADLVREAAARAVTA